MPRNNKIVARFTKEEYERVIRKAKELGLCPSTFLRVLALSSKINKSIL